MRALLTLTMLTLSGCASAPTSMLATKANSEIPVAMWIGSDGDACRFATSVDGPWSTSIAETIEKIRATEIGVRALDETRWKCVAGGIFQLQRAGVQVHFIRNEDELEARLYGSDQLKEAAE